MFSFFQYKNFKSIQMFYRVNSDSFATFQPLQLICQRDNWPSSFRLSVRASVWKVSVVKACLVIFCLTFFSNQAKGKERQWLKNQALGELDDAKIIDGLTGEKAIYKRRGELDPEVCSYVYMRVRVYIAPYIEPTLKYFPPPLFLLNHTSRCDSHT